MLRAPSRVEIAEARQSSETRLGLPINVQMGGDTLAVPNLVAIGSPDPWFVVTARQGVVDMSTAADRTIYIGGMAVAGQDVAPVDAALAAGRMLAGERHDAMADERRLIAGRHALRVQDAMVRARLLDIVDGWSALVDTGTVIDQSADGLLIDPPASLELACRVLVVTCPSTHRRYALRVPATHTTAAGARLWSFGDEWESSPEVET